MAGFHGFSILSENVLEVIENRDVIKMLKFMWARLICGISKLYMAI